MTSKAKAAASRRNAQLSTGPRTLEGKGRSAQNARKFGLAVPLIDETAGPKFSELRTMLGNGVSGVHGHQTAALVAICQVELERVYTVRRQLTERLAATNGDTAKILKLLCSCERYERRAFSKRKKAMRQLSEVMLDENIAVVNIYHAISIKK